MTQLRVRMKCWHMIEGSTDLCTAHPPQPQAPRSRRGSLACASQGAKLAAQMAVGSLRMRGVRRMLALAHETARFWTPPLFVYRPTRSVHYEAVWFRSAPVPGRRLPPAPWTKVQAREGLTVASSTPVAIHQLHPRCSCGKSRIREGLDWATAGGARTGPHESPSPCCGARPWWAEQVAGVDFLSGR